MNVYITKANASKIIKLVDLKKITIEGDMYIRNNIVLNAMFSKYEKQELLAYKMLMEDPESFMSEIYEKLLDKKGEDSYWWIYENHSSPAYHLDPECPLLCSNFKNYRIPASIRFRRITKAKNVESIDDKILTEEEKRIVHENVDKYRKWWKDEGFELFKTDKDLFLMHVNNKFQPDPRVRDIKEFEWTNSGIEEIDNSSLQEIEDNIDKLIKESGKYYYQSKKHISILKHYAKWTSYAYKEDKSFPNNDTGYTDNEIRFLLKEYNESFKDPLKTILKEYYRRKNNPDLAINENLTCQLGFKPCKHCSHNSELNSTKVLSEEEMMWIRLESGEFWNDEELEIMVESDEYNDSLYWEELHRYNNIN